MSLAFSIYSGRGIYAVLLGSGVSRSAEIPTGWEVTMDLVRHVAALQGENCEPNPVSWYSERFGKEPDYSVLLEQLAKTSAERSTVLAGYFEPSQGDRENGRKLPTVAHRQIAELAAKGYIKVIITTNFDRLMEQALESEGVVPTVISTVDAIKGAMPLQHAACTIVKVHGDYRDIRFRNTTEELASYPAELNLLLDRIIDEYGMVVCGWSATWDHALRASFLRSPNRRFTTAWASKGQPSNAALDLISFRQATLIDISSADNFFSELRSKVDALERFNAPHPLSAELATSSVKRLLSKPEFRIELHDLVTTEVEKQLAVLNKDRYLNSHRGSVDEYGEALGRIEQSSGVLLAIVTTGITFGEGQYAQLWSQVVTRLSNLISAPGGTSLAQIRRYPASLIFYAAGVAACAVGDYGLLRALFTLKTSIERDVHGAKTPIIEHLIALQALNADNINTLVRKRMHVPASERMFEALRPSFLPTVPNDTDFAELFDRFEYLLALAYVREKGNRNIGNWAPPGRFAYRNRHFGQHISNLLNEERAREGVDWKPIAQNLFSIAEYEASERVVQELLKQLHFY